MRWQGRRGSENVIDTTGDGGGGGRRRGRGLLGGGGLGTIIIALVLYFVFGVSPSQILQIMSTDGQTTVTQSAPRNSTVDSERKKFVSVVLADTEDVWKDLFAERGQRYTEPRLVLFEGGVDSACGYSSSAVGPFYCPPDQNLYLDLAFFDQLSGQLGAPGDFAQAYVIGHEIGHHVQNLTGVLTAVAKKKRRLSKTEANALQVRVELQADYYAGVWAHHAQKRFKILEPGDIEEALRAASSIGDDTLQKRSQGYVVPDAFTHGSSAQRVRWFRKGFQSGSWGAGDTFSAKNL